VREVTTHVLPLEDRVLHGRFDAGLDPVLTVASGDVVRTSTLDAGWHTPTQDDAALDGSGELAVWPGYDAERDPGHALVGPIAVAGAEPGMTVEVRLLQVRPGSWGWTGAGGWSTWANEGCGVAASTWELLRWRVDADAGTAVDQHGDRVRLRPFLGVVGLCPAGSGAVSTVPPRRVGGNLDCRELVAGSSLLLPVEVPGGLLSFGDGHAVQGDGEVSGLALECPMEGVELQVVLHPDLDLPGPRARTPAGEVVLGTGTTVDEATLAALNGVVDLLAARHGLTRERALALCSVAVDLRVTQIVNGGVFGVHAVLPPGRLEIGHPSPGLGG
jgi:acetamidase/formamidase